jgi:hypothetical protein
MDTRRKIATISGHLRRHPSLSLGELNLLARKISSFDGVTFAKAHEQIESFMGGVDLAAPRSSTRLTDNGASADEKKWMAYPYIAGVIPG